MVLSENLTQTQRENLETLQASENLDLAFRKRHEFRYVYPHGEAGSVDPMVVASAIFELRVEPVESTLESIYNMDETDICFKLMPRKTYIVEAKNYRTVHGSKIIGAKNRITAYVCTNADCSKKLSMGIIGKSNIPRWFSLVPRHMPYFSQKNAWSNTSTFKRWFEELLAPHVPRQTTKNVVLLIDN